MFKWSIFGSPAESLVDRAETERVCRIAKILAAEAQRTALVIKGHEERNHIAERMAAAFDREHKQ